MSYSKNISPDYVRAVLSRETEKAREGAPAEAVGAVSHVYFAGVTSSEMAEKMISDNEPNGFVRRLIHFCFSNKETLKKVPVIGKKLVEMKNRRLSAMRSCIDISPYLPLHYSEFIPLMYRVLLGREPDSSGLASFNAMVKDGASNAALAYVFASSKEFGSRACVMGLGKYKDQYRKYLTRSRIKRIPVLGRIAGVFALPTQLRVFYDNFEYYNSKLTEAHNALSWRLDVLGSRLADIERAVAEKSAETDRLLSDMQDKIIGMNSSLSEAAAAMEKRLISSNAEAVAAMEKRLILSNAGITEHLEAMDRVLSATGTALSECIGHINRNTSQLQDMSSAMSLSDQNLAGMTVGLHEKADEIARISTILSQKLDGLPGYISQTALKTKTAVPGIPGGVVSVLAGDYIFGVPSEEWGFAHFLSLNGHFEKGTEEVFCSLLRPGMNVLDLGANLGMFTLHALSGGCNVYSFEPSPRIYRILNQNIKANGFAESGRVHTFEAAVSDRETTISFFVCEAMSGHSNMYSTERTDDREIKVRTVVMDNFPDIPDKVDIVKIDIEGAEYAALQGMKKVIERNPGIRIFIEFAPENMNRAGVRPESLLDLIKSYGFYYYMIDEASGKLMKTDRKTLLASYSVNLLLTKEKMSL